MRPRTSPACAGVLHSPGGLLHGIPSQAPGQILKPASSQEAQFPLRPHTKPPVIGSHSKDVRAVGSPGRHSPVMVICRRCSSYGRNSLPYKPGCGDNHTLSLSLSELSLDQGAEDFFFFNVWKPGTQCQTQPLNAKPQTAQSHIDSPSL